MQREERDQTMSAFCLKDIKESNHIKKEICENCKKDLQGILSDDQLKKFEDCFYGATANAILERRKEK